MGDPDIPLKGFPWKGGAERDTSGILMWSEPFEVLLPSGEKVCFTTSLFLLIFLLTFENYPKISSEFCLMSLLHFVTCVCLFQFFVEFLLFVQAV